MIDLLLLIDPITALYDGLPNGKPIEEVTECFHLASFGANRPADFCVGEISAHSKAATKRGSTDEEAVSQ